MSFTERILPQLSLYLRSPRVVWTSLFFNALFICMLFIDLPLALFLSEEVSEPVYAVFRQVSRLGNATYWVIVALLIYVVPNYLRPFWNFVRGKVGPARVKFRYHLMTLWILLTLALGGLIVNILKYVCGRSRPAKFLETGVHEFDPFIIYQKADAFPSGHSQTVWGAVVCLWFIYPRLRPLYIFVGLMVSLSRLILLKHYLSDVIAGAVLSIIVGLLVKKYMEKRYGKFSYA